MFSERLKKLRKENNMTQTELAKALGVSGGTVAMWETDKRKPSFEMLEKLSEIFDKQLSYIMGTSEYAAPISLYVAISIAPSGWS